MPFRFILPLHMLITHCTSRKYSYATTSPDAHTYSQEIRSLLDFIKMCQIPFLPLHTSRFILYPCSVLKTSGFLSIMWMWSCSNHHNCHYLPVVLGFLFFHEFCFLKCCTICLAGALSQRKNISRELLSGTAQSVSKWAVSKQL